jgi:hypothetical protein
VKHLLIDDFYYTLTLLRLRRSNKVAPCNEDQTFGIKSKAVSRYRKPWMKVSAISEEGSQDPNSGEPSPRQMPSELKLNAKDITTPTLPGETNSIMISHDDENVGDSKALSLAALYQGNKGVPLKKVVSGTSYSSEEEKKAARNIHYIRYKKNQALKEPSSNIVFQRDG